MNPLLEIAKQTDNLEEVLMNGTDGRLLFHFSPMRKNVLEWYEFVPGAAALEIGGGCGPVTGLLCEKGLSVVSLEPDADLAEVNAYRNRAYAGTQLDVRTGGLEALAAEETFDYVIWLGVDATEAAFRRVKRYLKPEGVLLFAADNRYGLKYLAGAPYEKTGTRFDGVQGYSRRGIGTALHAAGFAQAQFYYPVPDYRLPAEIYSDRYLPQKGALREKSPNYEADQVVLLDEVAAFDRVCEDGLFPEFANSFLVVCSLDRSPVIYAKYNSTRQPCFRMATYILEENGKRRIQKKPLCGEAEAHIARMKSNYSALRGVYAGVQVLPWEESGKPGLAFPFVEGEGLLPAIGAEDFNPAALTAAIGEALSAVLDMTPENRVTFSMTEEFAQHFPDCTPGAVEAFGISNMDSVFSNFVKNEQGVWCIDYEWVFEFPVPVEYIAYRALLYFYKENAVYLQKQGYDRDAFLKWFIPSEEAIALYDKMELAFQQQVHGQDVRYIYLERYKKHIDTIENMQRGLALKEQHIQNLEAVNQTLQAQLAEIRHGLKNPIYGAKLAAKKLKGKKTTWAE